MRQSSKDPEIHQIPFQGGASYRLRFIFTADICGAWSAFGGLSAQMGHLSAGLHLSTSESTPAAFPYGKLLSIHLGGWLVRGPIELSLIRLISLVCFLRNNGASNYTP